MAKNDQDRARIRAYHRDRAIVRRITLEGSSIAKDRMTEPELWAAVSNLSTAIRRRTAEGRDVELARLARDLEAVADELFMRGHQMMLPGL